VDTDLVAGRNLAFGELFGAEIRRARLEAGFTGTELAERVGRTQTWVSYIETGRSSPDPATLVLLAQALGIQPGEFFSCALEMQRRLERMSFTVLMCRRPHRQDKRVELGLVEVTELAGQGTVSKAGA
jgi:transcriptional regulator with XRE-family HTH domain